MPWASACLLVLLSPSVQAFTAAPRTRSWLAAVSVAGIGLRAGLSGRQFVPALGGAKQKSHRKHGVGPVCVCVCVCVSLRTHLQLCDCGFCEVPRLYDTCESAQCRHVGVIVCLCLSLCPLFFMQACMRECISRGRSNQARLRRTLSCGPR